MNRLIIIVAVLVTALAQSDTLAMGRRHTPTPEQMRAVQERCRAEQERRKEAESGEEYARKQAGAQAKMREGWQLAALGIGVLAIAGFIAGTALGSKGKRDAEREPESA